MKLSNFRAKITASADYLISRQNPDDGGWGLNIENDFQASSIVNTAEAIFVIKRSSKYYPQQSNKAVQYLKNAVVRHLDERGPRLRYLLFGVWGLLEAGIPPTDPVVQSITEAIESQIVGDLGWGHNLNDQEVRVWPTFLSLWMVTKVFGSEYTSTKYNKCLARILSVGRNKQYKWGFGDKLDPSLAATAYSLIILSETYPGSPEIIQAHKNVCEMLDHCVEANQPVEVEPLPGTDWYHYSYCWALKALHSANEKLDEPTYATTLKTLKYIDSLFLDNRGYSEPDKRICNVRSIYNNVLALSGLIEHFDPSDYFFFEEVSNRNSRLIEQRSVFLSFNNLSGDRGLIEGLRKMLEASKFIVFETDTRQSKRGISKETLLGIKKSEKFIMILTRGEQKLNKLYSTSSWLVEERGVAMALERPCLILIEEDVDEQDIGGLPEDSRIFRFNRDSYTSAVADIIRVLG